MSKKITHKEHRQLLSELYKKQGIKSVKVTEQTLLGELLYE